MSSLSAQPSYFLTVLRLTLAAVTCSTATSTKISPRFFVTEPTASDRECRSTIDVNLCHTLEQLYLHLFLLTSVPHHSFHLFRFPETRWGLRSAVNSCSEVCLSCRFWWILCAEERLIISGRKELKRWSLNSFLLSKLLHISRSNVWLKYWRGS